MAKNPSLPDLFSRRLSLDGSSFGQPGRPLGAFDIQDRITDPKITLYDGDTVLATNDDWNDGQDGLLIASLGEATGAFAFAEASKDAALARYLEAGRYSVRIEPAGGSAGVALVEIYLVPDTH